jgi:hypothetical protein
MRSPSPGTAIRRFVLEHGSDGDVSILHVPIPGWGAVSRHASDLLSPTARSPMVDRVPEGPVDGRQLPRTRTPARQLHTPTESAFRGAHDRERLMAWECVQAYRSTVIACLDGACPDNRGTVNGHT